MNFIRLFVKNLTGNIAAILVVVLVCIAVAAVFLRYITNTPLAWAEELQSLILLWIILIGSNYAMKKNALLRMDIFYHMFSAPMQRVCSIIQDLIQLALLGMMIYFGWHLALQVGSKMTPLLEIKTFWFYLSLPVGALGMFIISSIDLVHKIKKVGE